MSSTTDMNVEILSPEKSLFRGQGSSLVLPGKLGYMTILPGHAKMIAELGVGVLELVEPNKPAVKYFTAGGFVEVDEKLIRVLVDVIEKPSEINVDRAKKAQQRAEQRLSGKASDTGAIDYARAQAALLRAQGRLMIASAISRM